MAGREPKPTGFEINGWQRGAESIRFLRHHVINNVRLVVDDTTAYDGNIGVADEELETLGIADTDIIDVLPVGAPIHYEEGSRTTLDTDSIDVDDDASDDPIDRLVVPEENGLFRVSMPGVQSQIALVIEMETTRAYMLGRFDQMNEGTNNKKYVKARDLGRIAKYVEEFLHCRPNGDFDANGQDILRSAVEKHGSLLAALRQSLESKRAEEL